METGDVNHLIIKKPWFWGMKIQPVLVNRFCEMYSNENLSNVWTEVCEEFKALDPNNKAGEILVLNTKIDQLIYRYNSIKLSIDCLRFSKNEELIKILRDYRYKLRDDYFHEDLNAISDQVESILLKIERYKSQLPKEDETKSKHSIYDVIASYSAILGYNINANTVTVREFFAVQNQVKQKVKALETNG